MIKSSNINIITNTLLKAARILRRDFNEIEKLQNSKYGTKAFVNNSIKNISELIMEELNKARPNWPLNFLGEQIHNNKNKIYEDYEFFIKPVSGITNYSRGISYFASSISVMYKNEAEVAVVYDPIKDDLFLSEKGKGAFLNNSRIRTSSNRNLSRSLIVFENEEVLFNKKITSLFKNNLPKFRILGSASLDLAIFASGKVDCYVCKAEKIKFEPALLLIKESGGIIVNKKDIEGVCFLSNSLFSEII